MPENKSPFADYQTDLENTRKLAAERLQEEIASLSESSDWGKWIGGLAGMLMGIPGGPLAMAKGASIGYSLGDVGERVIEGEADISDVGRLLNVGTKLAGPKVSKVAPSASKSVMANTKKIPKKFSWE